MTEPPKSFQEWLEWVRVTSSYDGAGTGTLSYPTMSLTSEVGEFNGLLTKWMRRYTGGSPSLNVSELDQDARRKGLLELYDIMHCLGFLMIEFGVSIEELIEAGYWKLIERINEGSQLDSNRIKELSLIGKTVTIDGKAVTIEAEFRDHFLMSDETKVSRQCLYRRLKSELT